MRLAQEKLPPHVPVCYGGWGGGEGREFRRGEETLNYLFIFKNVFLIRLGEQNV